MVVIPAFAKDQKIPDQHTRKLNGVTLIQQAISLAKSVTFEKDIFLLTDIEEIGLIGKRNKVHSIICETLDLNSDLFLSKLKFYHYILFLRSNTPLVDQDDILNAFYVFTSNDADILVTLKKVNHNVWPGIIKNYDDLLSNHSVNEINIELRSFLFFRPDILMKEPSRCKLIPYYLGANGIEIYSNQDWWICEKLLQRKRILFVVAGNAEIGMGHIYRSLTLAHEIHDHEIRFLCTRESELALQKIAEKYYQSYFQSGNLLDDVLSLKPDIVINDFLDTSKDYMVKLRKAGIRVINFEDLSDGALESDLTINELIDKPLFTSKNTLWGYRYLFLRDEFNDAVVHQFTENVKTVMITFGGTDPKNYTMNVLKKIYPYCRKNKIEIMIVAGPGYSHKAELNDYIKDLSYPGITYTWSTNVMSHVMEKAQIAVSSNGRTIYELAHMNIPSIIIAQNTREELHKFSNARNGFINFGIINHDEEFSLLLNNFRKLVEDHNFRKKQIEKMFRYNFLHNKKKVVDLILGILNQTNKYYKYGNY
jgi:spore coat polysaccharide biosynthesis predicted glycosyltransferase SpsG